MSRGTQTDLILDVDRLEDLREESIDVGGHQLVGIDAGLLT